jgi:hypothetical protein
MKCVLKQAPNKKRKAKGKNASPFLQQVQFETSEPELSSLKFLRVTEVRKVLEAQDFLGNYMKFNSL